MVKYRGKDIKTDKWVHGYYFEAYFDIGEEARLASYIIEPSIFVLKAKNMASQGRLAITDFTEVHPDTIGQYIEVYDDDGVEICEGDLVLANDTFTDEVIFGNGGFIFGSREPQTQATPVSVWNHLKIVGTIYDEETT